MAFFKELIVKITGDSSGLQKETKKAQGTLSQFDSQLKGIGTGIAAAFSVRAVFEFGKQAVSAYQDSELSAKKLLVALNGNTKAQQLLIAQAAELQKTTIFEDDQIVKAQTMLALLVKDSAQIQKLIPLVLDLAAAKDMDLVSAADLVAKSLGSEINALGRYGIQVEGAVGSTARLDSLMVGLSKTMGGQAVAAAQTAAGAVAQLKNEYSDLLEVIGAKLSPSVEGTQRGLVKWIRDLKFMIETGMLGGAAGIKKAADQLKESGNKVEKDLGDQFIGPLEWKFTEADLKAIKEANDKASQILSDRTDALKKARQEQSELLKQMREDWYTGGRIGEMQPKGDLLKNQIPLAGDRKLSGGMRSLPEGGLNWNEIASGVSDTVAPLKEVSSLLLEVESGLKGIGDTLIDGADNWRDFGKMALNAVKQAIAGIIALGIANAIENTLEGPAGKLGPIGVGIAALAGGLAAGVFSTLVPSFAGGGIVNQPTLAMVGDNPGRKEAIIPSEMWGKLGGGRLEAYVTGRQIKFVLDQENAVQKRGGG